MEVPDSSSFTIKNLVEHITTHHVAERPELFAQDGSVYVF